MKSFNQMTIIMVSYNSSEKIMRILNNINKKFKVIVIENSQDKKLKKKILKLRPNTKVYLPKKNRGFGAGLNYGIKKSKTKFILYLDIDIKINNKDIEKLYKNSIKLKNFGVVTVKLKKQSYDNLIIEKKINTNMSVVSFNTGCVMFFNREVFKSVGLFDERFFLYFEETDFYERCKKNKKKIYLYEDFTVHHEGRSSINDKLKIKYDVLRNWHYCWSKYNFYLKHFGLFQAFSKTFPNFRKSVLGMMIYLIKFDLHNLKLSAAEFRGLMNAYLGKKSNYRI